MGLLSPSTSLHLSQLISCPSSFPFSNKNAFPPNPTTFSSKSALLCTSIHSSPIPSLSKPGLYGKFAEFSVREVAEHGLLHPFPFPEEYKTMVSLDGETLIKSTAFHSMKIGLFRIATINGGDRLQALNLMILPRVAFDFPIFCADFFSTGSKHIIVLDLNPLYNIERDKQYKMKYYPELMPLVNKYKELLPWGGEFTAESLQFFSPLLIWTRLNSRTDVQKTLYVAFQEYLQAWLKLMDQAEPARVAENQDAQHRYLLWRAVKDPGRPVLTRLLGEKLCESYVDEFLFNGFRSLGNKVFLDFFPEYRHADGSINKQRSIIGKSYPSRPWDENGNLIAITS